jgi:hypothetical protein
MAGFEVTPEDLPALPTDLHEHIVLAGIFGGHA